KFNGRRNGARGPDYFQADVRAGWRRQIARGNALELFLDIYNITNRTNFVNPVDLTATGGAANRAARLPATFLVLTNCYGGRGFPIFRTGPGMSTEIASASGGWSKSSIGSTSARRWPSTAARSTPTNRSRERRSIVDGSSWAMASARRTCKRFPTSAPMS